MKISARSVLGALLLLPVLGSGGAYAGTPSSRTYELNQPVDPEFDLGGLSARAVFQFDPEAASRLTILLINTSVGAPDGFNNADQLLTSISFDFGAPGYVGDPAIVSGFVTIGPGSFSLNFDQIDEQLTAGADVSGEWGYGNMDGTGLLNNFVTALQPMAIPFGGENLDGPIQFDGPQGAIAADPPIIPLGGLGAVSDSVIIELILDQPLPDLSFLEANGVRAEFGGDSTFVTGDAVPIGDCNGNGIDDNLDIAAGTSPDCNLNGIPDHCDLAAGTSSDDDENGIPDGCVIWVSTTGPWSDPLRWQPMVVPDNTPTNRYFATINNFGANVTLDIDAEIQGLTLGAGVDLRGEGTPQLNVTQGNLTLESPRGVQLDGNLIVGSGFAMIAGDTFGIRGTSPVNLAGASAAITSRTDGDVMTSRSGVRGFGLITADFINESVVSADVGETTLRVTGPGSKVNNGRFEAVGGGRLLLTDLGLGRTLAITGSGDYEVYEGTMQLGEGGPAISVSGHDLRVLTGGQVTMYSPWSLFLDGQVQVSGGVFDPDVETSGVLDVPLVRVCSGSFNLGAETIANIEQIDIGYCGKGSQTRGFTPPVLNAAGGSASTVGGVSLGEDGTMNVGASAQVQVGGEVSLTLELTLDTARDDRGLTPPVLNVLGGSQMSAGSLAVDEGAANIDDSATFSSGGPVTVGGSSAARDEERGLTPPVLNILGGGQMTAGSLAVEGGEANVGDSATFSSGGPVTVGSSATARGGERGLTPPVMNIQGGGQVSGQSIEVVDGGEMSIGGQGTATAAGQFTLGGDAARGLIPPVLNMTGNGRLEAGGNFQILTFADITVGEGNNVRVGGDFQNESTDPSLFNWDDGTLTMGGFGARSVQLLEVGGEDRGQLTQIGFEVNFSFGVLEIGSNATVSIVDLFDNQQDGVSECDESAYVDVLIVQPGSLLTAGECKLYFNTLVDNGGSIPELGTRVIPIGGGDLDTNGAIDELDFAAFLSAFGSCLGDSQYLPEADLDQDGCVTLVDYQAWLMLYRDFIGNPLAPLPLTVPGDGDLDGDLDLYDHARLQRCVPASQSSTFACLLLFDANGDHRVDQLDTAAFSEALTGPQPIEYP